MAVKPRRKLEEKKPISAEMERYFLTGEEGVEVWGASEKRFQEALEYFKTILLSVWIKNNPCRRPWGWWVYLAPRWEDDPWTDCYYHGTFAIPRRRLGGVGDPNFEHLNYGPHFSYGIPTGWVSKFDEEYYNGRAKDIHGNPIGTEYKDGDFKGKAIDSNDPPVYESEAAYLERLGLLTPAEKRYLEKHQELLKPQKIKLEEGE